MREEVLEKIVGNKDGMMQLVQMEIRDDEIQEIIEKIQEINPKVSMIDLDRNNLSDKGAIILSRCLHNLDNLKTLSIEANQIGKEGAIDLFSLKRTFPNLDISFRDNKITNVREMDEIEHLAQGEPPRLGR